MKILEEAVDWLVELGLIARVGKGKISFIIGAQYQGLRI
jgi:hypothetical protein